jgi:hypothetical protein
MPDVNHFVMQQEKTLPVSGIPMISRSVSAYNEQAGFGIPLPAGM